MLLLINAGYKVTIMDNFSNSCIEAYNRMKVLAGDHAEWMKLEEVGHNSSCMHSLFVTSINCSSPQILEFKDTFPKHSVEV